MKEMTLIMLLFTMPVSLKAEDNLIRTWTSSDGKHKMEAKLLEIIPSMKNAEYLVLETRKHEKIKITISKLSKKDKSYLKEHIQKTQQYLQEQKIKKGIISRVNSSIC